MSWVEMIETTIAIQKVANSRCMTIRASSLAEANCFLVKKATYFLLLLFVFFFGFLLILNSYFLFGFSLLHLSIDHYRSIENEPNRQLHSKNGH